MLLIQLLTATVSTGTFNLVLEPKSLDYHISRSLLRIGAAQNGINHVSGTQPRGPTHNIRFGLVSTLGRVCEGLSTIGACTAAFYSQWALAIALNQNDHLEPEFITSRCPVRSEVTTGNASRGLL